MAEAQCSAPSVSERPLWEVAKHELGISRDERTNVVL